jgi:hypothetical protein
VSACASDCATVSMPLRSRVSLMLHPDSVAASGAV